MNWDKQPPDLAELLDRTLFEEPCKSGIGNFFDESRTKWEKHWLQNGLWLSGTMAKT